MRRRLLGLSQDLRNRRDPLQPMHLKVRHIHHRHARESVHRSPIALEKESRRLPARSALAAGFPPGQDDAGCQTLKVPLKGPPDGFIEVVDVEHQPPIGRRVGAQVANMGVAAELGKDPGMGQHRQVRSHDRNRAAKKTKGRSRHPLPLDRQQRRYPPHRGDGQRINRIGLPVGGTPALLLLTGHLLAPRLTKGAAFRRRQHVLNGHAAGAPSPRRTHSSSRSRSRSDTRRSAPRSRIRSQRYIFRGWCLPS